MWHANLCISHFLEVLQARLGCGQLFRCCGIRHCQAVMKAMQGTMEGDSRMHSHITHYSGDPKASP